MSHARRALRRGKHAAPRSRAATVVLPGVLLAASGGALTLTASATTSTLPRRADPAALAGAALLPASRWMTTVEQDAPGARETPAGTIVRFVPPAPAAPADLSPDRASRSVRAPLTYVRPVDGRITSPFGLRWGRLHAGIDFAAPIGTPVRVMADGVVEESGYDAGGYGNVIKIRHVDGTLSVYGHLSVASVQSGAVLAGDVIGLSGNTGHSTGPHLHFELRGPAGPFDPAPWLAARGLVL